LRFANFGHDFFWSLVNRCDLRCPELPASCVCFRLLYWAGLSYLWLAPQFWFVGDLANNGERAKYLNSLLDLYLGIILGPDGVLFSLWISGCIGGWLDDKWVFCLCHTTEFSPVEFLSLRPHRSIGERLSVCLFAPFSVLFLPVASLLHLFRWSHGFIFRLATDPVCLTTWVCWVQYVRSDTVPVLSAPPLDKLFRPQSSVWSVLGMVLLAVSWVILGLDYHQRLWLLVSCYWELTGKTWCS
jgi:hypothetical protein